MHSVGWSDSVPRTEGWLKALLWPSIRSDADAAYVTEQGFWVCFILATVTLAFSMFARVPIAGIFEFVFYFLAGLGVRQRRNAAAMTALVAYVLDGLAMQRYTGNGFGVLRIVFLVLLLSSVRGTWLSARWKRAGELDREPIRPRDAIFDKVTDQLPGWVWPKAKWVFACVAAIQIGLTLILLTAPLSSSTAR
jgi:hypothetical protein